MRRWLGMAVVVCVVVLALLAGFGEFTAASTGSYLPPPSLTPSVPRLGLADDRNVEHSPLGSSVGGRLHARTSPRSHHSVPQQPASPKPRRGLHFQRRRKDEGVPRGSSQRSNGRYASRTSVRDRRAGRVSPRPTFSSAFVGERCTAGISTCGSTSRHSIRPSACSVQRNASLIACSCQAAKAGQRRPRSGVIPEHWPRRLSRSLALVDGRSHEVVAGVGVDQDGEGKRRSRRV